MNLAVLGLGFMGSTHLKALRNIPDATLTAVYSSDSTKRGGDLSQIQGNLGGPGERMDFTGVRTYDDLDALLADENVDAVDICLPTRLHAPVALAALRQGKHVFVEKPMALDGPEAQTMVEEARARNRVLMVAQVLRFFDSYVALREAMQADRLGTVRSALFRRRCAAPAWSKWLANREESGGGVFDLLIHDVDMCLHLFGAPQSVEAAGYEDLPRGIDLLHAVLHYAGGLDVVVTGGWHHPKSYPFSMEYTVVGDGATAEYSSAGRDATLYKGDGATEPLAPSHPRDGYEAEIAYFVECCRAGRSPELCPPEESAAAVELFHLLLDSRRRNGDVLTYKR